jgi:hypothetical protein
MEGAMDAGPATLTIRQAYEAMLVLLEREADLTDSEDIAELVSQYAFKRNGEPRDPDAWDSWLKAVAEVAARKDDGSALPKA